MREVTVGRFSSIKHHSTESALMKVLSDILDAADCRPYISSKSRSSERLAFTLLASVCSYWHHTLTDWSESSTPDNLKRQLRKLIERECIMHIVIDI